jgi:hypothetical protein
MQIVTKQMPVLIMMSTVYNNYGIDDIRHGLYRYLSYTFKIGRQKFSVVILCLAADPLLFSWVGKTNVGSGTNSFETFRFFS